MQEPQEKPVSKWAILFWIAALGIALMGLEVFLDWAIPKP
jgi:hypothetical protein